MLLFARRGARVGAAVAVAAGLLVAVGLTAIPAALAQTPATSIEVTRYAGADRYETALAVANQLLADAGGSLEWAVMVSGRSWPDAVVASSLAGALSAPVLLTPPTELLDKTVMFLEKAGIARLLVVGSADSSGIGHSVVAQLSSAGYSVERVAGSSRSATSIAAARRLGTIRGARSDSAGDVGSMPEFGATAIVASSDVFADALVAGPVSAYGAHPVLLNPPRRLDSGIATYLIEARVEHVVLMGGTAALKPEVQQELSDLGLEVTRLAGSTRFETAVLMADLVSDRYTDAAGQPCFSRRQLGLARARVPFDAFSAAPLLARRCASLLLSYPRETNEASAGHLEAVRTSSPSGSSDEAQLHVFGGTRAISNEVLDAYRKGEEQTTGIDSTAAPGACNSADEEPVRVGVDGRMRHMAWTGDCTRLLFVTELGAMSVANGDGSNPAQLLAASRKIAWAAWSPDGRRIAFAANKRTSDGLVRHIHVMDADGAGELQLTDGPVNDDLPSWSPDGRRLVFQRRGGAARDGTETARGQDTHIVIIEVDGRNETPLVQGGATERFPSFSPDGRHIAFTAAGSVWTMRTDGSGARVIAAADEYKGASWSPDGSQILAVRPFAADDGGPVFVVADVNGPDEHHLLISQDLRAFQTNSRGSPPQWSPDGRQIFVHFADRGPDGTADLFSVNWRIFYQAPKGPNPRSGTCKPSGPSSWTAGFPLPDWSRASTDTLSIALLFIEFPDAVAPYHTEEEMPSAVFLEEYLETMSAGRLDVEIVPRHGWLRAERSHEEYLSGLGWFSRDLTEHAVELADPSFDFSGIDIVMAVPTSAHFSNGGNEGPDIRADGNVMRSSRVNHRYGGYFQTDTSGSKRPVANAWGEVAAHEVLHSLGLAHYYWDHLLGLPPQNVGAPQRPPELPEGKRWEYIEFGPLGLNAQFPVRGRGTIKGERFEMLAWSRWQLGWLSPGQVVCITEPVALVRLSPVAEPGSGASMAAVEVSSSSAIVIESRRLLGYDTPSALQRQLAAEATAGGGHADEGVLVYTVNPHMHARPLRLAHDTAFGYLERSPLLGVGESVSVAGYTISVTGDTGTEHIVSVRKND